MHIKAVRANPAGNITLLVTDTILPAQRARIANIFLKMPKLAIEQVGFVVPPILNAHSAGRLEMMGGEFCGNAARAFGLYLAQKLGNEPREVTIEMSGCNHPITVFANPAENTASAQMPLPQRVLPLTLNGFSCIRVDFDGIAHLVADCPNPNNRLLDTAAAMFDSIDNLGAYGVIFFDHCANRITPAVTVKATNSLIWEGSCGSGSVATAIAQTLKKSDGDYRYHLLQPDGCITVSLTKAKGAVCRAFIGGAVTLDAAVDYII